MEAHTGDNSTVKGCTLCPLRYSHVFPPSELSEISDEKAT